MKYGKQHYPGAENSAEREDGMMAETIIFSVILLVCAVLIILIGIVQCGSKEPVGFWSGKKPPEKEQITDVKAYNRKHGIMWILLGTGIILCFGCGLIIGGAAAGYLCMIEIVGGIVAMILYHNRLEHIYRKKG